MEKFTTRGLVIRVGSTGETTRLVWVLTPDRGVIRAFAKGAKSPKSRLQAATALFSYCSFTFHENKGVYNITEADVSEVFFGLRNSLEALALAQYFCDAASETVPEDGTGDEYLRLLLNCLHFLCTATKNPLHIKAVFEMRLAVLSGYMPALVACDKCGCFETPTMYFDTQTGFLLCENCRDTQGIPLPFSVVCALRHIVFAPFERLFSFSLKEDLLALLNECTERYLLQITNMQYRTLDYYKSVLELGKKT